MPIIENIARSAVSNTIGATKDIANGAVNAGSGLAKLAGLDPAILNDIQSACKGAINVTAEYTNSAGQMMVSTGASIASAVRGGKEPPERG